MEFDFLQFVKAAAEVITFGGLITIALGTALGKGGAEGRLQFWLTWALGTILGGVMMVAQMGVPQDFAHWVGVVVIGLLTGLSGIGVYEAGKHAAEKGVIAASK